MFSDASYAMRYKPLTWLAYALVYKCCGLSPFAYHLVNLVFHGLNAVLVFVLIRRLMALSGTAGDFAWRLQRATLPAALGALLWACHPLRVEPVARITDLTYCQVLFFLLISLWCYLRAWESRLEVRTYRQLYGCSVAAYALAMLTYPLAFGWAVVLLALDWYPLRRFEAGAAWWRDARLRRLLREKVPFVLLGALVMATLFARANPSVVWAKTPDGPALDWFGHVMQAFYVWTYYLWRPWLPFHLSPVYTALVDFNSNDWRFWLSGASVVGVTALVVWKRQRWPWVLVLWTSYVTVLLPALGLTEHPHYTSDRYDYLPGLVWALIIAAGLLKASSRPRLFAAGTVCAIALAAFWATLSFGQMLIWRDTVSLFEHAVRELGQDPRRSDLRRRLAALYAGRGRVADAVQQYQSSLRLNPDAKTYQALGELLERNGDATAALTNYLASLELSPDSWIHLRAAAQLSALGRTAEAISQYRQALRLQPELLPALEKLSWLLATSSGAQERNGVEALRLAEQACALTHNQTPAALGAMAASYGELGKFNEAIVAAQRACDRAKASGDSKLEEKYRGLLKLFEAGRPYRE
jgi:cytochrome c-type biogenesis protein CcmH/NrfG